MRTIIVVLTLALVAGYALAGFPATDPTGSNQPARRPIRIHTGIPDSDDFFEGTVIDGLTTTDWTVHSEMPTAMMDNTSAASATHGYVAAGFETGRKLYRHAFGSTTWETLADYPMALSNGGAAVIGDTFYYCGGYDLDGGVTVDTLFKYSISSNSWTSGPGPFSGTGYNWSPTVVASIGRLYYISGCAVPGSVTPSKEVWAYTPGSGWARVADMNQGRVFASAAVYRDTIWVAGGVADNVALTHTEFYNPMINTWTVDNAIFPQMPAGRWGAASGIAGKTMFVASGVNAAFELVSDASYFDFSARNWSLVPGLAVPVYRTTGLGNPAGDAFIYGGSTGGFTPSATVQTTNLGAVTYNDFLWLYADDGAPDTTLGVELMAMGDTLDYREVRFTTPMLEELLPYRAVGLHSNYSFANPEALGNVLADYVDAGGGVVVAQFGFATGYGLGGRLMSGDYATLTVEGFPRTASTLGWYRAEHPIMAGVSAAGGLFAGDVAFASPDSVARWEDGRPYVGISRNQRAVGVNSYPGMYSFPERTGDWARVFRNALHYVTAVQDVGIKAIIAPTGTVDSGAVVVPMARVQNYGNSSVSFPVVMRIGPAGGMLNAVVYADTQQISDLAPGDSVDLSFVAWTAIECGVMVVKCSTMLDGDISPGNDAVTDSVLVEPIVGVKDEVSDLMPLEFGLDQPVPNPFSGQVRVSYALPGTATVSLRVYCPAGKLVRTLRSGMQQPGYYRVAWDGRDNNGKSVGKGIYYYRLDAGDYTATRKVVKSE